MTRWQREEGMKERNKEYQKLTSLQPKGRYLEPSCINVEKVFSHGLDLVWSCIPDLESAYKYSTDQCAREPPRQTHAYTIYYIPFARLSNTSCLAPILPYSSSHHSSSDCCLRSLWLLPMTTVLKSPTGTVIGKSTASKSCAKKIHKIGKHKAKLNAPPIYIQVRENVSMRSCERQARREFLLTICSRSARAVAPSACWKKTPAKHPYVMTRSISAERRHALVRMEQTVYTKVIMPIAR